MIAASVRVSTKDQNPDLQREEISSRAKANGIEKVTWYEDRISGDKSSRLRLNALRKDIFSGKVKTVILWKLDRLARSKKDGEVLLADWCDRNVRVVSVPQHDARSTDQADQSNQNTFFIEGISQTYQPISVFPAREA